MTQIPLPVISRLSSYKSPCTTDNQPCDVSQVFAQRLCPSDISYDEFFQKYLLQNRPCIFSSELTHDWLSRRYWVDGENGKPHLAFLKENFGDAVVPVANCGQEKFSSHCKEEMRMDKFLDYWESYISEGHPESKKCLYLKDWHFTKAFPSYQAYSTPVYFLSDWMNEFWDSRADSDDDYRFVYMGPKGSWTPFHADVFRSYSWSANICGRKRWIFIPPGEENKYRNKFGNLVYDMNSDELNDLSQYPCYSQSAARIEVIQEPGEVIFVPSGWHHQVHNLEDTISINHNWMNGCNIRRCWNFLQQELSDVQHEISDCRDMDGWQEQCQLILKASSGIDYGEFYRYLVTIATHRMEFLQLKQNCDGIQEFHLASPETDYTSKQGLQVQGADNSKMLYIKSQGLDHSNVGTECQDSDRKSDNAEAKLESELESESKDGKNTLCDYTQQNSHLDDESKSDEKMEPRHLLSPEKAVTVTSESGGACQGPPIKFKTCEFEKSNGIKERFSCQSELDRCQCDRHIDTCQNNKQIDTCQSERDIDTSQIDGQIETCQPSYNNICGQSDTIHHDTGQGSISSCTSSKRETESQTSSIYHAIFDLIQVKEVLVDMLKTEELKLIKTNTQADAMIDKINEYV